MLDRHPRRGRMVKTSPTFLKLAGFCRSASSANPTRWMQSVQRSANRPRSIDDPRRPIGVFLFGLSSPT